MNGSSRPGPVALNAGAVFADPRWTMGCTGPQGRAAGLEADHAAMDCSRDIDAASAALDGMVDRERVDAARPAATRAATHAAPSR